LISSSAQAADAVVCETLYSLAVAPNATLLTSVSALDAGGAPSVLPISFVLSGASVGESNITIALIGDDAPVICEDADVDAANATYRTVACGLPVGAHVLRFTASNATTGARLR
jgi:hypothetical protein